MKDTFHKNANDDPFLVICKVGALIVVLVVHPSALPRRMSHRVSSEFSCPGLGYKLLLRPACNLFHALFSACSASIAGALFLFSLVQYLRSLT